MTSSIDLDIYGANRGGTEVVRLLPASVATSFDRITVADPKPGRARALADELTGVSGHPRVGASVETAQRAIILAREDAHAVLAIDSVDGMAQTLGARRPNQALHLQIVGRGPGGTRATRLGLQGSILPGDEATDDAVRELLAALADLSREASSRAITAADPLTAAALRPTRIGVTRRTVEHLSQLEHEPQDLAGGPLSLHLAGSMLPVVIAHASRAETHRARKAIALDQSGAVPMQLRPSGHLGERLVVVAVLVDDGELDFVTVTESRSGRRSVVGIANLAPVRAPEPPRQLAPAALSPPLSLPAAVRPISSQPGVFTD